MLKVQWFFIRCYMYWTLAFRHLWYVIVYKGEDNIPLEKIKNLRIRVKFKGRELGYSSKWVREKLLKQQLENTPVINQDYLNVWTTPRDG